MNGQVGLLTSIRQLKANTEFVEARYDLRITIIGDRIFPAAIHSQETRYKVDCRIDINSARIEPADLPHEVETRLHDLIHCLGLTYGAVDMRLTPDGDYIFLEINPAGQFMYIEAVTGQPMAASMATELHRLDRAANC